MIIFQFAENQIKPNPCQTHITNYTQKLKEKQDWIREIGEKYINKYLYLSTECQIMNCLARESESEEYPL